VSSPDEARLLERLLRDPGFRARFREDPAGAARDAGFTALADQLGAAAARSMETLELRESRSSFAGVLVAGIVEGVALFELAQHGLPQLAAEDALASDQPPRALDRPAVSAPVEPDDLAERPEIDDAEVDDAESDDPDTAEPDEEEPDEEERDEEEPDEEEPDEEEPDEEEPDERGPDIDDLTDDERDADGSDARDGADGDDEPEGDDSDDPDPQFDTSGVPDGYPGDSATRDETAAWMAHEASDRGLPAELPVMAALVESDMRNLPHGDADSVGFFQMRLGIWNTGEYAGYPERPELQLDWFLDNAEAVKARRLAGGLPVDDDHYGEWIADVERPAEQYRGRYQLQLDEARGLLKRAFPDGDGLGDVPDDAVSLHGGAGSRAKEALAAARTQLGRPYRWGGESPRTGFDCSGLVQWAYRKAGIDIPRVTDQQFEATGAVKVRRKDLLPGDLVFFGDATGYIHHVGMSLGGDRFIESPRTGLKVRISSLDEPYYANQYAGARRFDAVSNAARVMPVLRPDADG
jgi:hypothetical protein